MVRPVASSLFVFKINNYSRMQMVICSASVIILILFVFVQYSFFTSNYSPWQQSFWSRRINLPSKRCEAESIKLHLSKLVTGEGLKNLESTGISCSSTIHSEQCVISEPIVFDKQSLTIYIPSNNNQNPPTKRTIKPYARRDDETAMDRVSPIHIHHGSTSSINPPACQITHNVPALVFSFGGFSDSTFHEFNEIVIPLFITSRHFGSSVQFVITDYRARWVRKFDQVFKHLSRYPVVDADSDETVHCFPAAVVGLRYHDNLGVNKTDIPNGYTIASFKQFLRHSYNLRVETILKPKRPKLLLLSRQNSRKFINEDEMVNMMENLGFQVYKAWPNEMSKLAQFAQTVNSCDMMVGAHGAGLTNQVFLPNGAVVVQVVPLGLEWASEYYFAKPSFDMGLKYLGYKVEPNETSLYDLYGPDDPVISDPAAIWAKGYVAVKDVYVEKQDFIIDLARFKRTLLEALKLLG